MSEKNAECPIRWTEIKVDEGEWIMISRVVRCGCGCNTIRIEGYDLNGNCICVVVHKEREWKEIIVDLQSVFNQ
jgi:hypothetical protein